MFTFWALMPSLQVIHIKLSSCNITNNNPCSFWFASDTFSSAPWWSRYVLLRHAVLVTWRTWVCCSIYRWLIRRGSSVSCCHGYDSCCCWGAARVRSISSGSPHLWFLLCNDWRCSNILWCHGLKPRSLSTLARDFMRLTPWIPWVWTAGSVTIMSRAFTVHNIAPAHNHTTSS